MNTEEYEILKRIGEGDENSAGLYEVIRTTSIATAVIASAALFVLFYLNGGLEEVFDILAGHFSALTQTSAHN
jgi:type III secretory pathway component EscT